MDVPEVDEAIAEAEEKRQEELKAAEEERLAEIEAAREQEMLESREATTPCPSSKPALSAKVPNLPMSKSR